MANGYKAWYRRNNPQNAREGFEAYNRPYKERYERPPEYAAIRGDAYRHFPERYNVEAERERKLKEDENKKPQSESKSNQAQKRMRNSQAGQTAVKSVVQSVVGNAVAIVVGAVVVAGGYQAIEAEKAAEQAVKVEAIEWVWSDDYDVATASLTDQNGVVIAELEGDIVVTEVVEATCTVNGSKTYIATIVYDDNEYTGTKVQTIPPTGHTFDEGKVVQTENGPPVFVRKCQHCDETITIELSENE